MPSLNPCVCCIFVSSVYLALRMENGLMSMRRSIARVVSFVLWYLPYGPTFYSLFIIHRDVSIKRLDAGYLEMLERYKQKIVKK